MPPIEFVERAVARSPRAHRGAARRARGRARRCAAAGVPARRPRLGGDVARLPAAAVRRRRRARPGVLAPRLRPLDAARARRALGRGLHAPPGPRGAARVAATRCTSTAHSGRCGCSATATAARSRCCTRRASRTGGRRDRDGAARVRRGQGGRQHRARRARTTCAPTCKQRLARYHDDPDSAFWGWNDIWLHAPFRAGTSKARSPRITLPAAGDAGRRRRIRHARADPRHRTARCRTRELRRAARSAATRRTATSPSA